MRKLLGIMLLCVLLVGTLPFVSAVEDQKTKGEIIREVNYAKEEYREEVVEFKKYDLSHTKLLKTEEAILQKCKKGKVNAEFCQKYTLVLDAKMPGQLIRTADGYVLELEDISTAAEGLPLTEDRKEIFVGNLAIVEDRFADYSNHMKLATAAGREGHGLFAYKILERITKDARVVIESIKAEKVFYNKELQSVKVEKVQQKLGNFIGEKEAAGQIDSEIINNYDKFVSDRAESKEDFQEAKDSFDSAVSNAAKGKNREAVQDFKIAKLNMKISDEESKQAKIALKKTVKGIKEDFGTNQ